MLAIAYYKKVEKRGFFIGEIYEDELGFTAETEIKENEVFTLDF